MSVVGEMQRMVNTYNHVPLSVLDLFEQHVKKAPASPALILENGSVCSYQVLNALAEAVGKEAACATKGSSTDEAPLVGVMISRGIGLVAAILGVLKSGSAYVPVDPKFPPDRQTYIFGQAKLQLLITDAECFEQALSLGVKVPPTLVLNLAAMQTNGLVGNVIQRSLHLPSFDGYDKLNLMRTGRAQVANRIDGGLMYVLYTSGSTGKPKGVMVKHRGVTSQMLWFADELQIGPHSRILGLATICFDISVLEMYLSLIRGAATIHCLSATQKDPYHLLQLVRSHGCTGNTTQRFFFPIHGHDLYHNRYHNPMNHPSLNHPYIPVSTLNSPIACHPYAVPTVNSFAYTIVNSFACTTTHLIPTH